MEQNRNRFVPEALADESASPSTANDKAAFGLAFDPVPVRERIDAITPAKQREFVEALADTGLVNVAAARIGVSEQCIARLRRRADARSFDLACHAARRIGARRLHALAWERAIEGTVKRHYYHGELISEERVFDNRLLIYLLGKTAHLLDEPEETSAVVRNWEPFVEAMEHGLPPPLGDAAEEEPEPVSCTGDEVWEENDGVVTNVPPPSGFDGYEDGEPANRFYSRDLTDTEQAAWDAWDGEDRAFAVAMEPLYNGSRRWYLTQGDFFPMEAEPSEPSAEARERGGPSTDSGEDDHDA